MLDPAAAFNPFRLRKHLPANGPALNSSKSIGAADNQVKVNISIEVFLEEDAGEWVSLASADDPAKKAAELASRYELSADESFELEESLMAEWEDATANPPPIYVGPTSEEGILCNCIASAELVHKGLRLHVADSALAGAGRGLFVQCSDSVQLVTLDEGTAICGYAQGNMSVEPHPQGMDENTKSVFFILDGLDSLVWFEGELQEVGHLLVDESIDKIAGHIAIHDEKSGALVGVSPDATYDGPLFFVPNRVQPSPLDINSFGQMPNDLAFSGIAESEASYEETSSGENVLSLVFELKRDEQQPNVLLPCSIILTLNQDITFANSEPMELGCRYGWQYWED